MPVSTVSRRHVLALMAGVTMLHVVPRASRAATPALRVVLLADLHSACERLPQILATIDAGLAASAGTPTLIIVNGDVFEAGNVVASRSKGAAEWAFLKALTERAPVVLNLGNHEPDLVDDLADCVRSARSLGIRVISNIIDRRTDRPFTEPLTELAIGTTKVRVVGIATDALNTYPKAHRPALLIPEPVGWAKDTLPGVLRDDAVNIVASHAGVVADKEILPLLADGTLLVGGHDHLAFLHTQGNTRYIHTGSWARSLTTATWSAAGISLSTVEIALDAPKDAALAALIDEQMAKHLTDAERAVVGRVPAALKLEDSGREVARIMAAAHRADVGLVGHTTFGTGFPEGDLTRFVYDSVVRFEGKLLVAEIDAADLLALYARANQDGDLPLDKRFGDYVYANRVEVTAGKRYRIVANDWTVLNAKAYLGRTDVAFTPVPDALLKATVLAALKP